jgi:hypothetical protein
VLPQGDISTCCSVDLFGKIFGEGIFISFRLICGSSPSTWVLKKARQKNILLGAVLLCWLFYWFGILKDQCLQHFKLNSYSTWLSRLCCITDRLSFTWKKYNDFYNAAFIAIRKPRSSSIVFVKAFLYLSPDEFKKKFMRSKLIVFRTENNWLKIQLKYHTS